MRRGIAVAGNLAHADVLVACLVILSCRCERTRMYFAHASLVDGPGCQRAGGSCRKFPGGVCTPYSAGWNRISARPIVRAVAGSILFLRSGGGYRNVDVG